MNNKSKSKQFRVKNEFSKSSIQIQKISCFLILNMMSYQKITHDYNYKIFFSTISKK